METNGDEGELELSETVYSIRIVIPNSESMEIQVKNIVC